MFKICVGLLKNRLVDPSWIWSVQLSDIFTTSALYIGHPESTDFLLSIVLLVNTFVLWKWHILAKWKTKCPTKFFLLQADKCLLHIFDWRIVCLNLLTRSYSITFCKKLLGWIVVENHRANSETFKYIKTVLFVHVPQNFGCKYHPKLNWIYFLPLLYQLLNLSCNSDNNELTLIYSWMLKVFTRFRSWFIFPISVTAFLLSACKCPLSSLFFQLFCTLCMHFTCFVSFSNPFFWKSKFMTLCTPLVTKRSILGIPFRRILPLQSTFNVSLNTNTRRSLSRCTR